VSAVLLANKRLHYVTQNQYDAYDITKLCSSSNQRELAGIHPRLDKHHHCSNKLITFYHLYQNTSQ